MQILTTDEREALRRRVLSAHGADPEDVESLLEFSACRLDTVDQSARIPLDDEAHVAAWREYSQEAREVGVERALRRRLVQFNFPVRKGISTEEAYRAATLRGVLPPVMQRSRLGLSRPEELELSIHPSIGGDIPVLVTGERGDFELLVQALTARGEPRPVPRSMGACMISGLNNWDRIRRYREEWERTGQDTDESAWTTEFKRLLPRKHLYQDRLIILSRGPYSGVSADDLDLDEDDWLDLSHRIRLEHECTHYLTLRVFGKLQHNVVEELAADFVGMSTARGSYSGELAKRFLGLESFPQYRAGGRLENYRGEPTISDRQFVVVQSLSHAAIDNLEAIARARQPARSISLARLVLDLVPLTLEELADPGLLERVGADSRA